MKVAGRSSSVARHAAAAEEVDAERDCTLAELIGRAFISRMFQPVAQSRQYVARKKRFTSNLRSRAAPLDAD
jgi:hypothetical protein